MIFGFVQHRRYFVYTCKIQENATLQWQIKHQRPFVRLSHFALWFYHDCGWWPVALLAIHKNSICVLAFLIFLLVLPFVFARTKIYEYVFRHEPNRNEIRTIINTTNIFDGFAQCDLHNKFNTTCINVSRVNNKRIIGTEINNSVNNLQ